jgi:hypothetical protein
MSPTPALILNKYRGKIQLPRAQGGQNKTGIATSWQQHTEESKHAKINQSNPNPFSFVAVSYTHFS